MSSAEKNEIVEIGSDVDQVSASSAPDSDRADIDGKISEQDEELAAMAKKFIFSIIRLRGVKIDRAHFLVTELHRCSISREQIEQAVAHGPKASGVDSEVIKEIAERAINFETRKSTAASFAAGLPGGFAMIGAIPADVTQFYVHAFRIMQKLAYIHGWQDFITGIDDVDDETLGLLAAFLGVMMGVSGAASTLSKFLQSTVTPAVNRNIAKQALTKTVWYVPMKKVLKIIGINVTKQSFARSVSKVVPIVGGIASGGITYTVLTSQSNRLKDHLETLPPPAFDATDISMSVDMILNTTAAEPESRNTSGQGETAEASSPSSDDSSRDSQTKDSALEDNEKAAVKGRRFLVSARASIQRSGTRAVRKVSSVVDRTKSTELSTPSERGAKPATEESL